MSINPSSHPTLAPLSVGNVVSASVRLYRDRLKAYFGVAVIATLWSLFPFLILIPIPILLISGQVAPLTIALLVLIWIVVGLYCSAKYTSNSALISRLVFHDLVERPESLGEARRQINPKFWIFLLTYFLIFLLSFGLVLGFYILIFLVVFVGAFLASSVQQNVVAIVVIALIGLIILGITLSLVIRFFIRFFLVEVPMAIEENVTATQTIGRSWNLTRGNVARIFLIITVAFLITIPIYAIAQIGTSVIQTIILRIVPSDPTSTSFQVGLQILSFIVAYIISLGSGVVILPFWQAIKAVIYYDLCTRREGLGLQMRDSRSQ